MMVEARIPFFEYISIVRYLKKLIFKLYKDLLP